MGVPVQRFSPSPGIYLERAGKAVTITGRMEMFGDEASRMRAVTVQQTINTTWTQTFADGYSSTCTISVRYRGPADSETSGVTQIEVKKMTGPSNVSGGTVFDKKMTLNANGANTYTWTAAHEFGHILGLSDRYSESVASAVWGQLGGQRWSTVQSGYDGNLMAVDGGAIGGKNIADLAGENEPGYFDDDDQVRLWVIAHTRAQIAMLPDEDKVRMINILIDGYFSESDCYAVKEICAAVRTPAGAYLIRRGVDLTGLWSSSQRVEVQNAFNRMP